jgi:hypothetical protein
MGLSAIKCSIAQHGKQHVTASSCQRDKGLVVTLSLADLSRVVGARDGISKCCESGQEQRALKSLVPSSGGTLTADG